METWKDIQGYEGRYQVSDKGRVRRLPYKWIHSYKPRAWQKKDWKMIVKERTATEGIMKTTKVGPYHRVSLLGECIRGNYLVHRLVFCTFKDMPLKFGGQKSRTLVLHTDDDPDNNALDNLFLGTQKDNVRDMHKKGRWKPTLKPKKRMFTEEDVLNIRKAYQEDKSVWRVGEIFGVSGVTVWRILNNKMWKNI